MIRETHSKWKERWQNPIFAEVEEKFARRVSLGSSVCVSV